MAKPSQPPPTVVPEAATQAPLIFAAPKAENPMILFSGLHRAVRVFAAHARPWGEPVDVIREAVEHCNALCVEIDLHFRDDLIAIRPGDCHIQLTEAFESRAAARAKPVARSARTAHPAASATHQDEPECTARTTIVLSNGYRQSDNTEAAIAILLEVLAGHPLNRTFEMFGGFVERDARNLRGEWLEGLENAVSFFGNFLNLSHVFRIVSNDPAVVEHLAQAIASNRARADYLHQPPPYDSAKLVIERKHLSAGRSEIVLTYDGQRIGQFRDVINNADNAEFAGADDRYWHMFAKRQLERSHLEQFDRANRKFTQSTGDAR